MHLVLNELKLPYNHTPEALEKKIRRKLALSKDANLKYTISRRSIDARDKSNICFVYGIEAEIKGEKKGLRHLAASYKSEFKYPEYKERPTKYRPVVVGCGPAGLACAYCLARGGYRPVVIERGSSAAVRKRQVEEFWASGVLNPESNVQFGEGGAGTFSDGKLNTMVKDGGGRNRAVLELFCMAGASERILIQARPHLGTDELVSIVQNIRNMITELGGEFRFDTKLTDIVYDSAGIRHIVVNKDEIIKLDTLILALGHSARDTFEMLQKRGLKMTPKAFAVGLRIEHPQEMIDRSMYGDADVSILGHADYKLTAKTGSGRGVYSFCMCPGGYVVNASSEPGCLAVNGMSNSRRDGLNANSAIVVTISPEDYYAYGRDNIVLSGVAFQRELERRAFQVGNGKIPVQLLEDFFADRPSGAISDIVPQTKGEYLPSDMREILPRDLIEPIKEAMPVFGRKISGFDRPDAIFSAVESRTSSPIRILRDEGGQSSVSGIYPCGEGAGYAGGITSAAMDGLWIAQKVIGRL